MDSSRFSAIGGALGGAVLTVGIGYINGLATQWRETKQLRRHLLAEAENARRHYDLSKPLNICVGVEQWVAIARLKMCKFHGTGLGSFDPRKFGQVDREVSLWGMHLMMVIRNNDLFIDEAILEFVKSGSNPQKIQEQVVKRIGMTVQDAELVVEAVTSLRKFHYPCS